MNEAELRELDRLMAERIMGWRQVGALVGGETEPRLAWEAGRIPQMPLYQWRPTEDIRQAMMVVEALQARGWQMTLETHALSIGVIMYRRPQMATGVAGRKQPALAICLAAKAATEGER